MVYLLAWHLFIEFPSQSEHFRTVTLKHHCASILSVLLFKKWFILNPAWECIGLMTEVPSSKYWSTLAFTLLMTRIARKETLKKVVKGSIKEGRRIFSPKPRVKPT